MSDRKLGQHTFIFNPSGNGGEALSLRTEFYDNGDSKAGLPPETCIYWNQELTLQSYCNSASFNLCGISINPEALRKLANELERKQNLLEAQLLAEQGNPTYPQAVDNE
jgi:hypothetical protein